MTVSGDDNDYCLRILSDNSKENRALSKLTFLWNGKSQSLVSFDDGEICELRSGITMDRVVTLELPAKAQRVFTTLGRPGEVVFSCVGGTCVLEVKGNRLIELDQSDISFSEPTIYMGDIGTDHIVQVTNTVARLIPNSSVFGVVKQYRPPNGVKIVSAVSCSDRIVLGLADFRVVVVGLSLDGFLEEFFSNDVNEEIVALGIVFEKIFVCLSDKTILSLELSSLRVLSRLVLSSPINSLAVLDDEIFVSTIDGVVLTPFSSSKSETLLANEPVVLQALRSSVVACCSSPFLNNKVSWEPLGSEPVRSITETADFFVAVHADGLVSFFQSIKNFKNNVFSSQKLFDYSSTINAVIPLFDSTMLLCLTRDCGIELVSNGRVARFPSVDWKFATRVEELGGKEFVLAASNEVSLWEVHREGALTCVWSKPMNGSVHALVRSGSYLVVNCMLDGENYFQVYAFSMDQVPVFMSKYIFPSSAQWMFSPTGGHILLVSAVSGLSSARITDNGLLQMTAESVGEGDLQISSCCLLDANCVVTGSRDGKVRIHTLPHDLEQDGLCVMNAARVTAEFQLLDAPIHSLLHCGDSRNIVYIASNNLAVLIPKSCPHIQLP